MSQAPTLSDLVGTPLMRDNDDGPPTPLRPSGTREAQSLHFHLSRHDFAFETYKGDLKIGWTKPYAVWRDLPRGGRRCVERQGWQPYFNFSLSRPIPGSRFTETHHHGWWETNQHEDAKPFVEQLHRTLAPAYLELNRGHIYRLDSTLVPAIEEYLQAYFKRSETLARIQLFAPLT